MNHFIIGTSLFVYIAEYNKPKSIILYILISIWFLRLAGYLFFTRIVPGHKDPRYEELAEPFSNKHIFFLI